MQGPVARTRIIRGATNRRVRPYSGAASGGTSARCRARPQPGLRVATTLIEARRDSGMVQTGRAARGVGAATGSAAGVTTRWGKVWSVMEWVLGERPGQSWDQRGVGIGCGLSLFLGLERPAGGFVEKARNNSHWRRLGLLGLLEFAVSAHLAFGHGVCFQVSRGRETSPREPPARGRQRQIRRRPMRRTLPEVPSNALELWRKGG